MSVNTRTFKKLGVFLFLLLTFSSNNLRAFPTSLYWTPCITDVLPTGTGSFQVSNYFTVFKASHFRPILPPDIGLSLGLFSWHDWKAEAGLDYFGGFDFPWFFNCKAGIEENKLFSHAPSFSIGIYDIGTRARITGFNVVNPVIGKTLPYWLSGGRFFLGGYIGSRTLKSGRGGYMLGYLKTFCQAFDCNGEEYWKWWLVADYASGKNFVGGGGVGIMYNFNSSISLLTGPTWFNNAQIFGRWKWTMQVVILFPAFPYKPPCAY